MTRVLILAFIVGFLVSCRENHKEEIPKATSNINAAEDLEGLWLVTRKGTPYERGKIYGNLLKEDISLHLGSWNSVVNEGLNLSSKEVFAIGYKLLAMDRTTKAVEMFELNVAKNPKSFNAYDSLAEAYLYKTNLNFP